jgi:prepilin-type N-terminal cleavage/methylation domain-containing protein
MTCSLPEEKIEVKKRLQNNKQKLPVSIRHNFRFGEKSPLQKGYTLIELLIAVMIMFLVFGLGMANLRGYQRQRVLEGAVAQVKGHLRLAQQMAQSGVKPAGCGALKLESITFQRDTGDNTTYHIRAVCTDHVNPLTTVPVQTYNLDPNFPGVNITNTTPVAFLALGKGVAGNVTITLSQSTTGQSRNIVITRGGEIR